MATATQICQMALDHIGATQISDISETSVEAQTCNRFYDPARQHALRDFPWGFAAAVLQLSEVTADPLWGYDYCYYYPANCLFIRELKRALPATVAPLAFRIAYYSDGVGKVIVTNEPAAVAAYTYDVTNTDIFDAAFVNALSWRLATDICMPLTKSFQMQQACAEIYQNYINAAGRNDAAEGRNEKPDQFRSFLNVR